MRKGLLSIFLLSISLTLFAEEKAYPISDVEIPQDDASIKSGAMIYYNQCRLCHNMKYLSYRHLLDIDFNKQEVNSLRGERPFSEKFNSMISEKNNTELFGMVPPDLSVMAKARPDGGRYIYTLLTSYFATSDTTYDNKFFPKIKMPDVLSYSIAFTDTDKSKIEKQAKDVSAFLLWASDPKAKERQSLGYYVIAYLLVLSFMCYFVMKRVWSRLDD